MRRGPDRGCLSGAGGVTRAVQSRVVCLFFFSSRRRHTRFDCDWSSDVCSSDLPYARGTIVGLTRGTRREHLARAALEAIGYQTVDAVRAMEEASGARLDELRADEIGRASCRERVEISVVAVSLKKKKI